MSNVMKDPFRSGAWIAVAVFFVVFDMVTTYIGMSHSGIVERNPLIRHLFESGSILMMIGLKVAFTAFAFWVDSLYYRIDVIGFIPIIPGVLIYLGLYATLSNVQTLAAVGVSQNVLLPLLGVIGVLTVLALRRVKPGETEW